MAYKSNLDKMLEAVLLDEQLMKFGKYEAYEVGNIYQALESSLPSVHNLDSEYPESMSSLVICILCKVV